MDDFQRQLVRLLEHERTGMYWHVKQVTCSRYIADFYHRPSKLAVFIDGCSDDEKRCLHHFGFHVLTLDSKDAEPAKAAEVMTGRAKAIMAMRRMRRIA